MLFAFVMLFTFVMVTVATFQYFNEKRLRTESLQDALISYATMASKAMSLTPTHMDDLVDIMPDGLRLTIIDSSGQVMYDNIAADVSIMNNHIDRPEVKEALAHGKGFNIRYSNTLGHDYYYVAIVREGLIVRTALAYTITMKMTYLRPDSFFMYFILALVIIIMFSLSFISGHFAKSIEALREFSLQKHSDENQSFPEGELGDIGRRILHLYKKNKEQKQHLQLQKNKLIKHFHYSDNGIAIFSELKGLVYNNSLFVQYVRYIAPEILEINTILENKTFSNINDFLKTNETSSFSDTITQGERIFAIKVIRFDDASFEIMISDISIAEKNRRIKREMTQNIAHELKTPVSSIKGYLETLISIKVSPEKQLHFLERASLQAERLSELVTDIAIITKMEESPNLYPKEKVLLNSIIDLSTDSSKMTVHTTLNGELYIVGSRNLLQTIFQNLIDNANRYAGDDAEIHVDCYLEDEEFYYFSVYDTGKGVPEKYLNRIFERFYRIDEGRNRNDGGTGLGLSLVKNSILMHGGDVQAKNRAEGGLNFLFTLRKK